MSKFIFLIVFFLSSSVVAEAPECHPYVPVESQKDADLLAMRGVACFEKGEFLQALLFYRQAFAISEAPSLKGGIGRCLQELGYPDLARQYFISYLSAQDPKSEGHQRIQQRLDVVQEKLDTQAVATEISTTPSNARVYLVLEGEHWEEIGTTPLSLKLIPGDYRIVVRRDDFQTREIDLTVSTDAQPRAHVDLTPQDSVLAQELIWRRRGVYTWIATTPFLAGSLAFYALSHEDESPYRTLAIVTGAIGVVGILSGTILYLAGTSSPGDASLYVTPDQVGWTFSF